MTNKEAIEYLKWIRPKKPWSLDKKNTQIAIDKAINALKQQTCGDCISRQGAHDVIENALIKPDDKWFNWMQKVCNRLAELPSVTPQLTRWIPVSERLPEEFESVLVCYKSQGGMAQCVAERLVNMDGSSRWSAMYGQEPIAWMPLPEPYKEESEDKE